MTPTAGRMMSIEEFATAAKRSARTIFRQVQKGHIQSVKQLEEGRMVVRISHEELAKLQPWRSRPSDDDGQPTDKLAVMDSRMAVAVGHLSDQVSAMRQDLTDAHERLRVSENQRVALMCTLQQSQNVLAESYQVEDRLHQAEERAARLEAELYHMKVQNEQLAKKKPLWKRIFGG